MQEFRPASVIAADTALAESIRDGDVDAFGELVDRFAVPVTRVARHVAAERSDDVERDTFLFAWRRRHQFDPGRDFGPWMMALVVEAAGSELTEEVERMWTFASATATLPDERRDALRRLCVDGVAPDDDAVAADVARDKLRLDRRVEHLDDADRELADPLAWPDTDPMLSERVVTAIESELAAPGGSEVVEVAPARSQRLLRPVLIGLVAAMGVLLAVIVGLSALSGAPEPEDFSVPLVPTGLVLDVDGGDISVTERVAGIQLDLNAPTLPRRSGGNFYRGVLVLDSGAEVTVGTFAEGGDVILWGGVALADVSSFRVELDDLDGVVPDGDVVLKADFPAR